MGNKHKTRAPTSTSRATSRRAAHARTMPTTMRARAVTPPRATTRATTKKRTEATRRVARAVTTTTRAVRDGDEVRDGGRAPWVTRVPMGREARRARGARGRRARRWCGAREICARDRRARAGCGTSRGCGYRWMNGWMDDDVVDVARSVAASADGTGLVSRAGWRDIAIEEWRRERMRDD